VAALEAWMESAHSGWLLVVTVVSIVFLSKGADWLVEGAAGLAYRVGMPKVIVGATIVSLGTTSPEAAVSVSAAWQGNPGLALGNAVGSIIADAGLIFGLCCVLATLPADKFVLNRQGWVQFGAGLLLAVICIGIWLIQGDDATIGRPIGFMLLGLLAMYMYLSVKWAREHPVGGPFQTPDDMAGKAPLQPHGAEDALKRPVYLLAIMLAVGLAIVIFSSQVMIGSVSVLALRWGVPEVVIAGTLVAFGTSAPELVIGIASLIKGHRELLVGNVIGADILNVLFVTGAAAAAAPLPIVDPEAEGMVRLVFLWLHLPIMVAILLVFRIFIARSTKRGEFKRWYGIPLLAFYVAFIIIGYLATGGAIKH